MSAMAQPGSTGTSSSTVTISVTISGSPCGCCCCCCLKASEFSYLSAQLKKEPPSAAQKLSFSHDLYQASAYLKRGKG
jgi:hypothetical protein